ncbi:hypothetical protein [Cryptosporangium sp. NPDC051539]|uniref:hypothetical protein n=1 Tax=Cryptosporangium sp. NPDC051539 TaxID=3363962 RepID=UPI0037A9B676
MNSGPATYGELMGRALAEVMAALREPPDFLDVRDAVRLAVVQGRVSRSADRVLGTFAIAAPIVDEPDRVPNVDDDELTRISALRGQLSEVGRAMDGLARSEDAFKASRPAGHHPAVASLLRGHDYAGAAWDLLETRVTSPKSIDREPVLALWSQDSTRTILADAATFVHSCFAAQDCLAPALLQGISRRSGRPVVRLDELDFIGKTAWLTSTLDAAWRDKTVAIRRLTEELVDRFGPVPLGDVDHLTAYVRPRIQQPGTPAALGRSVTEYSRWLEEHAVELTIADARAAIGVASRLTLLAGIVHPAVAPACTRVLDSWRACHHRLTDLASRHPSPDDDAGATVLAQGVSEILSALEESPSSIHEWAAATAVAVAYVPRFTRVIEGSLFAGRRSGTLLGRQESTRYPNEAAPSRWQPVSDDSRQIRGVQLVLRQALRELVTHVLPQLGDHGLKPDHLPAVADLAVTKEALATPLVHIPPSTVRRSTATQPSAQPRRRRG